MDELLKILIAAKQDMQAGATEDDIAAALTEVTGGRFSDVESLAKHLRGTKLRSRDVLRLEAQGLTAGFGDELAGLLAKITPGGKGYTEARDASRENLRNLREQHPTASLVAEGIGGAALPVGGAATAAKAGTAALVGAGTGAAAGGLLGVGEAEGSIPERLRASAGPALVGGLLGGLTGMAAPVAGRIFGARGPRVARELDKASGLSNNIEGAYRAVRSATQDVRSRFYKPLEEAFPVIDDPEILKALDAPEIAPHVQAALRGRPLSYAGLQQGVMSRLRRVNKQAGAPLKEQIEGLEQLMRDKLPGHARASTAYNAAMDVKRALDAGRKPYRTAADINMAIEKVAPELRDAFREGQLHGVIASLNKRADNEGVELLKTMLNAGPETKHIMRTWFAEGADGTKNYNEFLKVLRKEKQAARVVSVLKRLAPFAGVGAVLEAAK